MLLRFLSASCRVGRDRERRDRDRGRSTGRERDGERRHDDRDHRDQGRYEGSERSERGRESESRACVVAHLEVSAWHGLMYGWGKLTFCFVFFWV